MNKCFKFALIPVLLLGSLPWTGLAFMETPAKVKLEIAAPPRIKEHIVREIRKNLRATGAVVLVEEGHDYIGRITAIIAENGTVAVASSWVASLDLTFWRRMFSKSLNLSPEVTDKLLQLLGTYELNPSLGVRMGSEDDIPEMCRDIVLYFENGLLEAHRRLAEGPVK